MLLENDLLNKRTIHCSHMFTELEVIRHPSVGFLDIQITEMLIDKWIRVASNHLKIDCSKDADRNVYVMSVSGVVLTPEEYKELVRMATANKG